MKKALAKRSEVTAFDRVEAAWSSLEQYFASNATIERVFRDFRGKFKDSPAHIITVELVAGLSPPKFKTKVATALDMKGCWKAHPDLVYSVAREAAEAWATVEQADKLRSVHSCPSCRASVQCQGGKRSSSRARRSGFECSLWRIEAAWQLLELREGGSQDG